jgi:phosphatidylserine/phosphatidylglycerophosphate/cardiolipin synthase-like enzyme
MTPLFAGASASALRSLASAFRSGRLGASASSLTIARACPCPEAVATDLTTLLADGLAPRHVALLLDAHADAVEAKAPGSGRVELVWTGPAGESSHSRDTSVVLRTLFESAERAVLVSTFVVRNGRVVFDALARRMADRPQLQVRIFLHVGRGDRDTRHESELLREAANTFRREWPGTRSPEIYYDPRSLATDGNDANWHAKCVLVDDEVAFVTSANFTEWAQTRNVEAGVIVRDAHFASQLRGQFDGLAAAGQVRRLQGF